MSEYSVAGEFERDCRLVFENAKLYDLRHKGVPNSVYEAAEELSQAGACAGARLQAVCI